jgi:hypothetical protein
MGTFVSISATALLPAYMGWAHVGVSGFLMYALVAGLALATGERLTTPFFDKITLSNYTGYAARRCRTVLIAGGAVYFLALLVI